MSKKIRKRFGEASRRVLLLALVGIGAASSNAAFEVPGGVGGTSCVGLPATCGAGGSCLVNLSMVLKDDDPSGPCQGGEMVIVYYKVKCGSCVKEGSFFRCAGSGASFTVSCNGHTITIDPGPGQTGWGHLAGSGSCKGVEIGCVG